MGRHDDASVSVAVDVSDSDRRITAKKATRDKQRIREPSNNENLSEVGSRDEDTVKRKMDGETRQDGSYSSEVESETQKRGSPGTLIPRLIRAAICFLLFLAILFMFFVALSTPVIKPFYFFSLHDRDDTAGKFLFGIWGYCWPAISTTCVPASKTNALSLLTLSTPKLASMEARRRHMIPDAGEGCSAGR